MAPSHDRSHVSGFVDADEIAKMANSLGMSFSNDDLYKMIREADADGNGEIDFNEVPSLPVYDVCCPLNVFGWLHPMRSLDSCQRAAPFAVC